jgi:zinc transport system permease protein
MPYPFDEWYMQRALVAGLAVGVFAPLIGTFLVQKRLSLIGDGLGHVAFAGVGAGLLLGWAPIWAALVFAVGGALAVEWLRVRGRASGDVALALIFYSGIALGVVLISIAGGAGSLIVGVLFGQVLLVPRSEVITIVALGAAITAIVLVTRRALFSVVTDEAWSRVAGLPVGGLNTLLAVLTACAVVATMRVVGILLVAALMVLPVASAQLLARSFGGALRWSVAIGAGSVILGLALTRIWNLAAGGTIVLVTAAVFVVVAAAKRAAPRALRLEEHG